MRRNRRSIGYGLEFRDWVVGGVQGLGFSVGLIRPGAQGVGIGLSTHAEDAGLGFRVVKLGGK